MNFLKSSINLIHIAFLISLIIKSYMVFGFNGPIILEDEFEYKQNAYHIFYNIPGFYIYYVPPLYPLVISFSFLFHDHYLVMKFINVILTSLTVYPVFSLLKEFSDREGLPTLSLFTLILPIQFSMPNLVMSENLFLPLFGGFLFYMVRVMKYFDYKNSLFVGVFLGLLLLTRYFGVAIPPAIFLFFVVLYLFKSEKISRKKIIISFLIIVFVSAVFYLPWVFYSYSKISNNLNDFVRSSSHEGVNISQQYTIFVWFLRYLFYLGIMVSPFLSILIYQIYFQINKFEWKFLDRFLLFSILISFTFLFLAAYQLRITDIYNRYLNGRYISYLILPWMIYFFINLPEKNTFTSIKRNWLLSGFSFFISVFILIIAYNLHFRGYPWKISVNYIGSFNFLEGYLFVKDFKLSILYILLVNLFLILAIQKWKNIYIISILPFFLLNLKAHYRDLEVYINPIFQTSLQVYKENNEREQPVNIYYSSMSPIHPKFVENYFPFFNLDPKTYHLKETENYYTITEKSFLVTDFKIPEINFLNNKNSVFVYRLPIPDSGKILLSLVETLHEENIKTPVKEIASPWKKSIVKLKNQLIFASPESNLEFTLPIPKMKNIFFQSTLAFHPYSKNWNISDGVIMVIKIQSNSNGKKVIHKKEILPQEELIVNFSLDEFSGEIITINLISTNLPDNNNLGDWFIWINPRIVSK